ncbi:ATP-binding protein [Radiobacillus sp. PE A8.2]|uniref:ATP-binding protein n=1 Tax=Radiobacillus sp. PE A8.2 TaxID=3380349 RepID=UPI00388E77E4
MIKEREANMISNQKDVESSIVHNNNFVIGSHIIYVYSNMENYLDGVLRYVLEGIKYNQGILLLDTRQNIEYLKDNLSRAYISKTDIDNIKFVDISNFYQKPGQDEYALLDNLSDLISPFKKANIPLRVWGHVRIEDSELLHRYEHEADSFVHKHQLITVCAYNGRTLSASSLTQLLHDHEYYMTDISLVRSPFYKLDKNKATTSIMDQINREKSVENEVLRSEQLAFAGQFAAGICHEIRNPLTTIKGFFQLIKESNQKDRYYEVIDNELDRIERITSELLLLSKPHAERRENQNLIDLVNDVKMLLDTQAVIKSIEITTAFEAKEMIIECEDTKMKQVLINIIKNAIEIMEHGTISIYAKKTSDHAFLSVKDEGPGISENDLRKIGEPFFTTKKTGTGLGLAICFSIIKSHGGTVYIDSELGKGTTFTIKLPLSIGTIIDGTHS